jgi:hypothetical protein
MVANYIFWTNKLGVFPYSQGKFKPLSIYLIENQEVFVGESKRNKKVIYNLKNLIGRGVEVVNDGS